MVSPCLSLSSAGIIWDFKASSPLLLVHISFLLLEMLLILPPNEPILLFFTQLHSPQGLLTSSQALTMLCWCPAGTEQTCRLQAMLSPGFLRGRGGRHQVTALCNAWRFSLTKTCRTLGRGELVPNCFFLPTSAKARRRQEAATPNPKQQPGLPLPA